MSLKIVLGSAVLAAFSTGAFAQTTTTTTTSTEFYIAQDAKTKRCQIVDKRPTGSDMTIVTEGGNVYKTRTEAESALKTVKVCTQ